MPTNIKPWYREPLAWSVFAGPLIVVVAGFITLAIAIAYPDPVVHYSDEATSQPAAGDAKSNTVSHPTRP